MGLSVQAIVLRFRSCFFAGDSLGANGSCGILSRPLGGSGRLKVHLSHGFNPEAINAACTVSDIAAQERNNVTVNVFSTPHKCIRCGQPAEVFVGSKKLCATCWTSSVIENKIRQLGGKR